MRIVHLIDYFQPLLGYQETFLAREQLRLGHSVVVVTSDRYAPVPDYEQTAEPLLGARRRSPGDSQEEGIPVRRLPVRLEKRCRCVLKGLGRTLTELRPDVVHAHGVVKFSSIQAALHKRRLGFRLLVDDHMLRSNLERRWQGALFYQGFRRLMAPILRRRVDAMVAVTDETAAIVREIYGLGSPPVEVIELGVDVERFTPDPPARQKVRTELGFSPDDFVVVYSGKVIPEKGPHWLLEALARCPPVTHALVVGNASATYRQQIDSVIAAHGLAPRVRFLSAVSNADLPRYYAAADAACWPREASISMLEAAACGLPIIIVKGALAQRVRYGNGIEYREGDVAELAGAITSLVEDSDKASAMGARGRQLVADHHSWATINGRFLAAYGDSTSGGSSP